MNRVYIAVVGFCYGSIVPGEGISYTELEFTEAVHGVFAARDGRPADYSRPARSR